MKKIHLSILILILSSSGLLFGQQSYSPDTLPDSSYSNVEYRFKNKINVLWELNDTLNTLAYLDSLTHIDKYNSEPFYHKAIIYQGLRDYENAVKNINIAIDLASNDSKALYLEYITFRGLIYFNNEEYKMALNDFECIFAFDRNDYEIDILYPLGVSYIMTGNKDKGCKILKKAVDEQRIDVYDYFEFCK